MAGLPPMPPELQAMMGGGDPSMMDPAMMGGAMPPDLGGEEEAPEALILKAIVEGGQLQGPDGEVVADFSPLPEQIRNGLLQLLQAFLGPEGDPAAAAPEAGPPMPGGAPPPMGPGGF